MDRARVGWRPPVISYKVYVATTPGVQESATIGSIKGTDATVTDLVNGTVYYFMVTAVNAAGNESPFSTEVSAEPIGPERVVPCPRRRHRSSSSPC